LTVEDLHHIKPSFFLMVSEGWGCRPFSVEVSNYEHRIMCVINLTHTKHFIEKCLILFLDVLFSISPTMPIYIN